MSSNYTQDAEFKKSETSVEVRTEEARAALEKHNASRATYEPHVMPDGEVIDWEKARGWKQEEVDARQAEGKETKATATARVGNKTIDAVSTSLENPAAGDKTQPQTYAVTIKDAFAQSIIEVDVASGDARIDTMYSAGGGTFTRISAEEHPEVAKEITAAIKETFVGKLTKEEQAQLIKAQEVLAGAVTNDASFDTTKNEAVIEAFNSLKAIAQEDKSRSR